MATFLICHGAWSGGWVSKKMRPLMRDRGHEFFTPTYTGQGERAHLGTPDTDLETQIADILGALEMEDLAGVNLIGHSYGGMVATGVADRIGKTRPTTVFGFDGVSEFAGAYFLHGLSLHMGWDRAVHATLHGMVEAVSDGTRQEWLREAEALGHAAR
ncbi:MAG: alpha/beta fold hydrolase [Pseudolabrys sp.]